MYHSQSRKGVPPAYVNVGIRFIEPVNKTTEKHRSNKFAPYIKKNALYEKNIEF